MAPSNPRLAAGVGVLAACLLIGGPGAAAAIADPGGSHSGGSDRGSSADRGGGHPRGGSKKADNDRGDNGNSHRNGNRADKGDDDRRGDSDDNGNRRSSGGGTGNGNADTNDGGNRNSADAPVRVGSGRADIATVTPENGSENGNGADSGAATAPSFGSGSLPDGGSDSAGGSGSDPGVPPTTSIPTVRAHPATPGTSVASPPVTVGNGRSPVIVVGDPEPRSSAPGPVPASVATPPAEPPPPPAVPSWADRFYGPPATAKQLAVAAPVDLNGPLWAIAGLLLIPAAGAALGYRQARAAHAADRLRRTGTAAQVLAQDLS